jgi:hypothetical protein
MLCKRLQTANLKKEESFMNPRRLKVGDRVLWRQGSSRQGRALIDTVGELGEPAVITGVGPLQGRDGEATDIYIRLESNGHQICVLPYSLWPVGTPAVEFAS